jgi:hypothetical protein
MTMHRGANGTDWRFLNFLAPIFTGAPTVLAPVWNAT